MIKTRMTLTLMFIAAFVAGISVGIFVEQRTGERHGPGFGPRELGPGGQGNGPGPGGPGGGRGASWLTTTLSLTPAQEQETLKIWSGLERTGRQEEFDKRKALQKQRDDSVKALVPGDKHAELEKIHELYNQQSNELSDQRRKAFDAAVEKTKAILTADQREKYEEILARRPGPGGPGGRRGPGPGPGGAPGGGPTTRPAETRPAAGEP